MVQGVNQVVQNPPDLVLVDISIPAGNGFLFVERIRCLPEIGKIPVIFMTANKLPELRQKAEQLGAVGYFEKPFDSSKLLKTIEKNPERINAGSKRLLSTRSKGKRVLALNLSDLWLL